MDPSREIWNSFYDENLNLKKFLTNNEILRDLEMVFLVMQSKFDVLKKTFIQLENENSELKKENEAYKKENLILNCSRNKTRLEESDFTRISGISKLREEIIVLSEDSPKKNSKQIVETPNNSTNEHGNETYFDESLDLLDSDLFNQQISEMEINVDQTLVNDSVLINPMKKRKGISKKDKNLSPKLNKSKSLNRSIRCKLSKSQSPKTPESRRFSGENMGQITPKVDGEEPSIIFETPEFLEDKKISKVLKNISLNTPERKNELRKLEIEKKSEKRLLDESATFCEDISNKNVSDEEMEIEVMLGKINRPPFSCKKQKSSTTKDNPHDTSYKSLQIKKENPFKRDVKSKMYKEVVRKKSERENLPGWDCEDCEKYYKKLDLSESELKKVMKKCSRHKSKHKFQEIFTPKGYWNPDFTIQSQNE